MSRRRLLVALAALLAPLLFLTGKALFDPEIEFLRPSLRGRWIVDRSMPIEGAPPYSPDAIYVHGFAVFEKPATLPIRITAMREFEAVVNGDTLPAAHGRSWKRGQSYDLAPYLKARAFNSLRIRVRNPKGPPALLVEGPSEVRSSTKWRVLVGPTFRMPREPGAALWDEAFLEPDLNPLRVSRRFPLYLAGLILYGLFIVYALVPLRYKRRIRPVRSRPLKMRHTRLLQPRAAARNVLPLLLFVVAAAVQLRNARVYPYRHGCDWDGHVDYVRHVARQQTVPLATDGWQMYQPPLYYFAAAPIYLLCGGEGGQPGSLQALQVFTTAVGLAHLAIVWLLLWRLFPDSGLRRNLGFTVAALLPAHFFTNPMITNEVFAGSVIGLAVFLTVRFGFGHSLRWRDAVLVGLGCGLALLSKFTGLFVFVSVLALVGLRVVDRWLNRLNRRSERGHERSDRSGSARPRHLRWGLVVVAATLVVCGWFYVRNAAHFGNPFIGNWDEVSGFHYEQDPGYRTLGFYTRFGSVLFHTPARSRFVSFWDGLYASWWTDAHGFFLNLEDPDPDVQSLSSLVLWLAVLPTVGILLGFGRAVRHLITREWDHPYLVLVLATTFMLAGVVAFTMEVPFYSTIKGFFLLSLTGPVAVFAALGLETLCRQLGRLRFLLYGNVAILFSLVVYLSWYRDGWQPPAEGP